MRDSRHDRTIRPGSDVVDHAARITAEGLRLLAAMRAAGWKGCPAGCTCRGTGS